MYSTVGVNMIPQTTTLSCRTKKFSRFTVNCGTVTALRL